MKPEDQKPKRDPRHFFPQRGASSLEYGLLVGLIGMVAIGSVVGTGTEIRNLFNSTTAAVGLGGGGAGGGGGAPAPWEVPSEEILDSNGDPYPPGGAVLTFDPGSAYVALQVNSGTATVHWGDGTTDTITAGAETTVSKNLASTQDVVIEGTDVTSLRVGYGSAMLTEVKSFGNLGLTSLQKAFESQTSLTRVAPLPPTVTSLRETLMRTNHDIQGVSQWDTSNVTDMFSVAYGNITTGLRSDLSGWDVSNVTNLGRAFMNNPLNTSDLSGWCVSSHASEPSNFEGDGLTSKPVWGECGAPDTSNGIHMTFNLPGSGQWVNLSIPLNSDGGDVVDWGDGYKEPIPIGGAISHQYDDPGSYQVKINGDVYALRDNSNASYLTSVDQFGTVPLTSLERAFGSKTNLASVPPLPSTVTNLRHVFLWSTVNPTGASLWNTVNVTDMYEAMGGNGGAGSSIDVSGWDVSNVTNFDRLFNNNSTNTSDLSGWCVAHHPATPASFGGVNLAAQPNWGSACP